MKESSIWLEYKNKKVQKYLNKDIEVDVLIIGGGITGLSVAYNLIKSNLKVALVERNEIGLGVTSKTTAKISYLQENIYSKLKTIHNEETSKLYFTSQVDAIKLLKEIIIKNKINCNFEKTNSFLITFKNNEIKKVKQEKELLEKFGVKTKEVYQLPNNEICKYGFKVKDTYVFNPMKYLNSLKKICIKNGISIYENTKINKIDKKRSYYVCDANSNIIKTKYVVIATHYPYFLMPFLMPLKVTLEKSYIEAIQTKKNLKFNYVTIEKPVESFRYYTDNNKTYKVLSRYSHNICIKNNNIKNFSKLSEIYDYRWSNKDIVTYDYLPFAGIIKDKLLIGTGYNTWGMTNSAITSKVISDILLKKPNKYIELFDPNRNFNLNKITSFPLILSSNIYSFIKSKLNLNKPWYRNNLRFEKKSGKLIAIYTDKLKKEHIVKPICPHMKCGLNFNEIELTWDCPCHGSRFDMDGKCIEGPSNYNISYFD